MQKDTDISGCKEDSDIRCPICLDTISDEFKTSCGHVFCKKCIEECRKNKEECPLCRQGLWNVNIKKCNEEEESIPYTLDIVQDHFEILGKIFDTHNLINGDITHILYDHKQAATYCCYTLTDGDDSYIITDYLRNLIIFSHYDKTQIYKVYSSNGIEFYHSRDELNFLSYNWHKYCIDMYIKICRYLNFIYGLEVHKSMETMVNDLFYFLMINRIRITDNRNRIDTGIIATTYTVIKVFYENNLININEDYTMEELKESLFDHRYVPSDYVPIFNAYVLENLNFLKLKSKKLNIKY